MEELKGGKLVVEMVMVGTGLLVMVVYHCWLRFTILYSPLRTVIGTNAHSRRLWVESIMSDPLKNGTLAVQTIRNNMMASTLLATTAITLSSLISSEIIFAKLQGFRENSIIQGPIGSSLLPSPVHLQCAVY